MDLTEAMIAAAGSASEPPTPTQESEGERLMPDMAGGGVTVEVLSWVQDHRAQIAIGLIAVLLAAPVVWISGHPVAWWQRRKETEAVRKARKSARSGRGGTSNHDSSY
jgi:hypothetical protein